jgi:hypothetical protein
MSFFEVVVFEIVVIEIVIEIVVLEIVVLEIVVLEIVVFEDVFLEEDDFFISSSDSVVSLASFEDEQTFESLKNLILRVNQHADLRDYAIVLARIKKSKHDETRKT